MTETARRPYGDPRTAALLRVLAAGETEIDSLAAGSRQDAATVLTLLATLELEGRVERRGGTRYGLIK